MTQTETRIFHYDQLGHLIAETDANGQMIAEYFYIGDQLLAMIKPGEMVYYYHNDHLGTPQIVTNDSQAIAWKAVYTPFGEAVASIETVENPFRFPGQYYDQETGLHYNYFRYYNPQTGRYITPDPIGLDGGINLFTYVANNPVNAIDPSGLQEEKCQKGEKPTPEECMKLFFDCMAENLIAPGWSTVTIPGGQAAGQYATARAWQHAASRGLIYPLRSSIVRRWLSIGSKAGPLAMVGSVLISEGMCFYLEMECLYGD